MSSKFYVWCPDHGESPEDARKFEALDAQEAAEKWADWNDGYFAEYAIVGGKEVARVCVREQGESEVRGFTVSGRAVPTYTARSLPMGDWAMP